MSKEKWIMLNYDLGLKGDYESLYCFLDNHKALDCGNCNAALKITISEDSFDAICEEVKNIIVGSVSLNQTDRIYLTLTDENGKMRGKFICGGRKRATWEGFGDVAEQSSDPF
ncbi:hypothetical protein [Capnocytophaga canis]|uniref:Uncharacterized protein n=1 Tax=Capnocytophaga canis TaxID=1848903 RepID=A0A0B7IQN7_9FLAO|nr:hypothetical protein [Capnocytophaga canis]CEN54155.1 conserved hypothetical protein [Capnocytophaga canis]